MSEWADQNFYLVAESSYIQGVWVTLPYQRAIMDCMSNDDIRSVTLKKSARVGYTKMIVACIAYNAEHKRRNQVLFQPVDQDAEDFVKDEIDPMLRDCSAVQAVFPWYNTKSKYNTLSKKVFVGSTLDIRGGKAAKNYRRLSKDIVYYDEVDGFDSDIEGEGDPITLGDKRAEGATFPKSIRGSTPGIKGRSLISNCIAEADQVFEYHTPCPHCEHMQVLKWGGPEASFGMKWIDDDPKTVYYLCEKCASTFTFEEYALDLMPRGRWISKDGVWIDEDNYFKAENGEIVDTPEHVAFDRLWTAVGGQTAWSKIVADFIKARGDRGKLKTFVNTTLGEEWEEDESERSESGMLFVRRERYNAEVPQGVQAIVVGVDTQDDRFELQFDGYGWGEERWSLFYDRLYGDPSRTPIWDKLAEALRRTFVREDGTVLQVMLACQDHGGHYSDEVNNFSKRMGVRFLIPVKGASIYGKPIAVMPRKRNAKGVYLTEVGTDTAKSLLYQRYRIGEEGPGFIHWPRIECFDQTYFDQLCAEERIKQYRKGVPEYRWDAKKRRNEATDCSVYSLAAIRVLQQHFGFRFTPPSGKEATTQVKKPLAVIRSSYLGR